MINEISLLCLTAISLNLHNSNIICNNSEFIETKSIQHKIDPIDFVSILWVESRFTPELINESGSCGIAQINPKYTKYWIKNKLKTKKQLIKETCNIILDEKINITLGIEKYSYWYNVYSNKNTDIAICAYNSGFNCKGEKKKDISKNVLLYVNKVKLFSKRFRKKYRLLKIKIKSA
jgi:hypothetical protein